MKGFGNLLMALGIVAALFGVASLFMQATTGAGFLPKDLLPNGEFLLSACVCIGAVVFIIIGATLKSIGAKKEAKQNNTKGK